LLLETDFGMSTAVKKQQPEWGGSKVVSGDEAIAAFDAAPFQDGGAGRPQCRGGEAQGGGRDGERDPEQSRGEGAAEKDQVKATANGGQHVRNSNAGQCQCPLSLSLSPLSIFSSLSIRLPLLLNLPRSLCPSLPLLLLLLLLPPSLLISAPPPPLSPLPFLTLSPPSPPPPSPNPSGWRL
jgi:hypothetical protein